MMAMGQPQRERQETFWVATCELPQTPGHPLYKRLNKILDGRELDRSVLQRCPPALAGRLAGCRCRKFYADKMGRPSLPRAIYCRTLPVDYLEGIDCQRGVAWRVADSMALRHLLGYELIDQTTDHAGPSCNRRLIDLQTHEEVLVWVMQVLTREQLFDGKTLGIDATTLEANAALRSIVLRDTGEGYHSNSSWRMPISVAGVNGLCSFARAKARGSRRVRAEPTPLLG